MQDLVANYLFYHGLEATLTACNPQYKSSTNTSYFHIRALVRSLIISGKVSEAFIIIDVALHKTNQRREKKDIELLLRCQQFADMWKDGYIQEAVSFASDYLLTDHFERDSIQYRLVSEYLKLLNADHDKNAVTTQYLVQLVLSERHRFIVAASINEALLGTNLSSISDASLFLPA